MSYQTNVYAHPAKAPAFGGHNALLPVNEPDWNINIAHWNSTASGCSSMLPFV